RRETEAIKLGLEAIRISLARDPFFGLSLSRVALFAKDQLPEQFSGSPVARNVVCWLIQAPEQPAEIKAIGPHWNSNLVTGKKSDRGADTMNAWRIGEPSSQKQPQFFLRSPAQSNYDLGGPQ